MRGESVHQIADSIVRKMREEWKYMKTVKAVESILREGLAGGFDKEARKKS